MENIEEQTEKNLADDRVLSQEEGSRFDIEHKLVEINQEILEENPSPIYFELQRLGNQILALHDTPEAERGAAPHFYAFTHQLEKLTRQFEDLWMHRNVTSDGFVVNSPTKKPN